MTTEQVARSYLSNYLKIYIWQCLSIATSFLSMFIVVPLVSSRHSLFAIYSICTSLTLFVTYADFGFMTAGFRYANKSFAVGDVRKEIRVVGFVTYVLLIFVGIFAAFITVFALDPTLLIGNLTDQREKAVASSLLTCLALFSPTIVIQRMLQIIYGVRVEDYIYQRLNTIGNLLKVGIVHLFITESAYDIVGFFATSQLISALCAMTALGLIKVRYSYDLALLWRSVRFDKDVFTETKHLALNSMFVTMAWVVYYECDLLFLGRFLGPDQTAPYALALSVATFFRSLSSTVFSPFLAPMQRLAALHDDAALRRFYRRVMVVTLPVTLFPALSIVTLMKVFVVAWVGENYLGSVVIAQCLVLAFADSFSRIPASYVLVGKEKVSELYGIAAASPFLLWLGVLLAIHGLDAATFGGLKLLAAIPVQLFSFYVSMKSLGLTATEFMRDIIRPILLPSGLLVMALLYIRDSFTVAKSPTTLILVILTGGVVSACAGALYYGMSAAFRQEVTSLLHRRSVRTNETVALTGL